MKASLKKKGHLGTVGWDGLLIAHGVEDVQQQRKNG
jgi:hypothetical protein